MKQYEKNLYQKFKDNPFVYHYTSIEALFSILEGYRQNDHYALPFRAYSVYNTNDPREMKLGFDTVKDILPAFEKSYSHNMNLSEVYENPQYETECKNQCFKRPKDGLVEMDSVPYTISFSCKRDFLPMWSMYGANKRGVCLKFNTGNLIESLRGEGQPCFVYYAGDEDNIIKDYLLPILYISDAKEINRTLAIEEKIVNLSSICDCISPFVKCNDWAYEAEFRLAYYEHYKAEVGLKIGGLPVSLVKHKIKEYIENIPIRAEALAEVIIGPLANFPVVEHVLNKELIECKINNIKISPSLIQITK